MNFWHMQLHPNNANWKREEELLKTKSLIGLGEWDEGGTQQADFEHKMQIGDVVAIKRGADIVALVEVAGDYEYNDETGELDWFERRRPVKVLDWYRPEYGYYISPRGTLTRCNMGSDASSNYYINDWYNQTKAKMSLQNAQEILKYKKQIILQGPPGTGKTKLAKELAGQLTGIPNTINGELTDNDIVKMLTGVAELSTVAGNVDYEIVKVDQSLRQVTLKKSTESEATTSFDKIKTFYKDNFWEKSTTSNDNRRAAAIAKYLAENRRLKLESSDQFKLVQFHPSYSYEDFVRGIVAESSGEKIEYKSVNKTLGKFAADAKANWDDSRKDSVHLSKEKATWAYFEKFADELSERLSGEETIALTPKVNIVEVEEDAFRYKGKEGWSALGNRMLFKDIVQAFLDENRVRQDFKKNKHLSGLATQHASYFVRVLNMFQEFLKTNSLGFDKLNAENVLLKNYVLIIDEINRANLSSVLGELIYALEYRGEAVESMYKVNNSQELILPPNLYIIGTMNTADRSVGHIDYAIRRRFAFVDVPPKDLTAELSDKFHKGLFDKVAELFSHETNLSNEFEAKDVQLGHSYFIDKSDEGGSMDIRLQYEIKPILREYIKDGILIGEKDGISIHNYIDSLQL